MNEKSTRNPVYGRPRDALDPGASMCIRSAGVPTDEANDARHYIRKYAARHNYTSADLAQVFDMLGLGDTDQGPAGPAPTAAPKVPVWACGTIPGWLTHVEHNTPPCGPCATVRARYPAARIAQTAVPRARGRGVDMSVVRRAVDDRDRTAAASLTADERLAAAVRVTAHGGRPATAGRLIGLGWHDANRLVDLVTAPPTNEAST